MNIRWDTFKYWESLIQQKRGILPLEDYQASHKKIKHICLICGYKWKAAPGSINYGRGCFRCGGKEKISNSDYDKRLKDGGILTIKRIGRLISLGKKCLHFCEICKLKWKTIPNSLLGGSGCPKCSKCLKLTENEYSRLRKSKKIRVRPLEPINGSEKKVLHLCECGDKWDVMPSQVLMGRLCRKCGGKKNAILKTYTDQEYDALMRERKIVSVFRIGPIKGLTGRSKHGCKDCGHEWNGNPSSILKGTGCPECASGGFKVSKPAFFYIYEIIMKKISIIKFGITNNDPWSTRIKPIINEAKRGGKKLSANKIKEFYFENGSQALDIETTVKLLFRDFNKPIFKNSLGHTEMIPFSFKNDLLEIVRMFKE